MSDEVDDLLHGAGSCRTCALPNVVDIDRAVARYLESDAGRYWSWDVFARRVIKPQWGYPLGPDALRRHTEGCRGRPIQ